MDESNNGEGEDGDEEAHTDFSEGGEFNELLESGVDEKSKEGNKSENQNGVDRLNFFRPSQKKRVAMAMRTPGIPNAR